MTPKTSPSSSFACYSCRKFKCKCDGRRPTCSTCTRTKRTCEYSRGERRSGPRPGRVRYLEKRVLQLGRRLGMSVSDFAVSLNKRVFEDLSSSSPPPSDKHEHCALHKEDRQRLVKLFIQNFPPLCHLRDPGNKNSSVALLDPDRGQCPVLYSAMALGCLFDETPNRKVKARAICAHAYHILNTQEIALWEDLSMQDGVYTVYAWTLIGYFELICCRFQQATHAATRSNRIACLYGLNRIDTCFSEFRTTHRTYVRNLDPALLLNTCRFVFWVNIQLNEMMDASLMREIFTPSLTFVETNIPLSDTSPRVPKERAVDWLELLRAPLAYLSENASMGEIFSGLRAVVAAFHTLGRKSTLTKIEISWWWWRYKTLENAVDGFQLVLDNDFDHVCNLAVKHHAIAVKLLPYRAFLRLTSLMITLLCNRLGLQRSGSLSIFSSFDLDTRAEREIRTHVELSHLIDRFMLPLFHLIQTPSLCYPLFLGLQFFHPLYQVALTQDTVSSPVVSFLGSCTVRLTVIASSLAKRFPFVMSLLQPLLKDIARKSPDLMSTILADSDNDTGFHGDCLNVDFLRQSVCDAKSLYPSLPLDLRHSLVRVTASQYKCRPDTAAPSSAASSSASSATSSGTSSTAHSDGNPASLTAHSAGNPASPGASSAATSAKDPATSATSNTTTINCPTSTNLTPTSPVIAPSSSIPDLYPYFSWNLNPFFSIPQSPDAEPYLDPAVSTLLSLPPLPCDPNFLEPGVMPNAVEAHCASEYSEPLIMNLQADADYARHSGF